MFWIATVRHSWIWGLTGTLKNNLQYDFIFNL
jgi:hypothetical protein